MAGRSATPGRSVTSRALAILDAFNSSASRLSLSAILRRDDGPWKESELPGPTRLPHHRPTPSAPLRFPQPAQELHEAPSVSEHLRP